jgi:hypothetical protein
MASIAMLVSELAHSLHQPNNQALRENLKDLIIHTRNEVIRHGYENHGYTDRGLMQRFKVTLTDVNDGEIDIDDEDVPKIKRSTQKVPTPVRLTNNLPFSRVSTQGFKTSKEFPFIKETSARFREAVPGLGGLGCYDYINGYIYLFPAGDKAITLNTVCIEAIFENPTAIQVANGEVKDDLSTALDENEWLLSEDMIGQIKDIIYKRDMLTTIRETNEIPNTIKYK